VVTEDNVREFVKTMRETHAVISGSTALQFFDRTIYQGADLDLYLDSIYLGIWKSKVLAFGYKLVPRVEGTETPDDSGYPCFEEIDTVDSFKHEGTNKVIQLMATKASPVRAILDFHSSEFRSTLHLLRNLTFVSMCYEHVDT
jgi:hypothetical protein